MPLQLLRATHHELDLSDVGVFNCADDLGSQIAGRPDVQGVLVLATCNRFEVYLDAAGDDAATQALAVVAAATGRSVPEIDGLLQLVRDGEVAHHLLRVAAGLSSAVVGEQ